MRRDLAALRAGALHRLGELAVQGAPAQPGDIRVQHLARERVPEPGSPGPVLAQHPVLDQLGQAIVGGEPADELEVESVARDRGDLGRRARVAGELGRADQDGIADGVRKRDVAAAGAGQGERRGELLDEERHALGAILDRPGQRRRGRAAERLRKQRGGVLELERRERQLAEMAAAAQLVAQAAHAMVARQAVGAVCRDDEHGQLVERRCERRQQLERALVGPLQVVEEDQHVALAGDMRERAPHRLEQGRAVARRSRLAELGQDQRQVRPQRAAAGEAIRRRAQVRAQGRHDRPVRRRAAMTRAGVEHQCVRALRELGGQPRLAHARVAAHEQHGAASRPGLLQRRLQPLELGTTPDEPAPSAHARSLRRRRERNTACASRDYGDPADVRAARRTYRRRGNRRTGRSARKEQS